MDLCPHVACLLKGRVDGIVTVRIPWDRYEVALLFSAYKRVVGGADVNAEATKLSEILRDLATHKGVSIDGTFRNVNGMKMQLANVHFLFTDGEKGLSGASAMIRQMYELYETNRAEYQTILKEAVRMTGNTATSIEDAFFAYAKDRIEFPPQMLMEYLKKSAEYCHLKQPLLGMTDVKAIRNVQQKVAEGKLLRFKYGKDAQRIRNVTRLYYTFIKSYREPKEEIASQRVPPLEDVEAEQPSPVVVVDAPVESMPAISADADADHAEEEKQIEAPVLREDTTDVATEGLLQVNFSQDSAYLFTKPISYTYKGEAHAAKSWNRIYVEICGLLFADHHDAFMGIMNGDIPGYSALAFADERNYRRLRVPKSFAPGYYLESNLDATSIVRKIRGLHQLFGVGDDLQITYQSVDGYQSSQSKDHREVGASGDLPIDAAYDWTRDSLLLVDFTRETCYTFTQPDAYVYNGATRRVNKWSKLYADLCGVLFDDYHDAFMGIMNGDVPGYNSLAFADEQHKSGMRVARCFAPGYYLESNNDATAILRRIRGLYQLFELGDKLKISYQKTDTKDGEAPEKMPAEEWIIAQLKARGIPYHDKRSWDGCLWIVGGYELDDFIHECKVHGYTLFFKPDGCKTYPDKVVWWTKDQPKTQVQTELSIGGEGNEADAKLRDQMLVVAADAFPNGIRPGSIIDLNKLKRGYASRYNEEIPENADLSSILIESGLRSGEKVYILTSEQKQLLKNLIAGIFAEGHRVIYYSELLLRHGELLESCHLFEASLMRTVFASLMPDAVCKTDRMLADRPANEIEEVTRAFGEDLALTYQQIKERCPYLTLDVIKWTLSRSNRFVWSSPETFAQTDLIQLDSDEIQKVLQKVLPQIKADGYYSLAILPLEESCALNPQISISAVRDAMFVRHMADQCDRNGLIATPKGIRATTVQLLEGWCKEQDQLTIAELEAYERELTGRHAVLGIWAACYNMVRVDHDHFVSDALIDFDVDEVDRAIALFVGNRIVPITAITSFTSFPEIPGYTWNLYLVESFLRRFSRRFTIDGGPAQTSYVGGICPAEMRFESYEDRLAQAVIQDGISLTEDSIGRYTTEKKYILRRCDTVRKVLSKALILNEQRGDTSVRL